MTENDRELTTEERRLLQWMLENGDEQAHRYLWQIERAMVKPWRCSCGCASFDLRIADRPDVDGEMNVLADYVYGSGNECGIIVFTHGETLAGLEVFGYGTDVPKMLPSPNELRPVNCA